VGYRSNRWQERQTHRIGFTSDRFAVPRRRHERGPIRGLKPDLGELALERRELLTITEFKVSLSPQILYPPNSQYVPISVSGSYKVGPHQGPALANFQVVDEYRLDMPYGDVKSHPVPNQAGRYTFSFQTFLQARVAGGDSNGRLYTIAVSARQSDNAVGNSYGIWVPPAGYRGSTTVVPHAHSALMLAQRGRARAR